MHLINSTLALALAATGAIAFPVTSASSPNPSLGLFNRRDDNVLIATVFYYADSDCSQSMYGIELYAGQGVVDAGSGAAACAPAGVPQSGQYWAKTASTSFGSLQLLYTRDQTCPPGGPGAVFATLGSRTDACVEMNRAGDSVGLTVYPNGGAEVAKYGGEAAAEEARAAFKRDTSCSGFNIESSVASESESKQVSDIVDCTNATEDGCMISREVQHTVTFETNFSLSGGGKVSGIDIGATFGGSYSTSTSTSIQSTFTVPKGQRGYLTSYNEATLFKGTFTGCDGGDQPGQSLVLKDNAVVYEVVNTGS